MKIRALAHLFLISGSVGPRAMPMRLNKTVLNAPGACLTPPNQKIEHEGEELMTQVTMTVNGRSASGTAEGRTLLSSFLRDQLGLTGTHIGCDTSQCGACVVHVNGEAVKACTMLALEAEGADVATIEGQAAPDGTLNTIQQAFQDHHGLQCGFCTPGMVMSAAALLKDNPKPSEAEIREYLDGNICRCTGYHNIVKAIMAASGQDVSAIAAE
jgi:aerobic carbon-monoxide dehydrogenase small subunit